MSAPNNGWQMFLGMVISAIIGYNVYGIYSSFNINHDWSLFLVVLVVLLDLGCFYFLLAAAEMKARECLFKEFFGKGGVN